MSNIFKPFLLTNPDTNLSSIVEHFFIPTPKNFAVINPTDPLETGTLSAVIPIEYLSNHENISIITENSSIPILLTLPPVHEILELFTNYHLGAVRSWTIYTDNTCLKIVSPDVTCNDLPLTISPSTSLFKLYINLPPYSKCIPLQPYDLRYSNLSGSNHCPCPGVFTLTPTSTFSFAGVSKSKIITIIDECQFVDNNSVTLTLPSTMDLLTSLYGSVNMGSVPFVTDTITIINESGSSIQFVTVTGDGQFTVTDSIPLLASKQAVRLNVKYISTTTAQINFAPVMPFTI